MIHRGEALAVLLSCEQHRPRTVRRHGVSTSELTASSRQVDPSADYAIPRRSDWISVPPRASIATAPLSAAAGASDSRAGP
jgi:hypothetical protein